MDINEVLELLNEIMSERYSLINELTYMIIYNAPQQEKDISTYQREVSAIIEDIVGIDTEISEIVSNSNATFDTDITISLSTIGDDEDE